MAEVESRTESLKGSGQGTERSVRGEGISGWLQSRSHNKQGIAYQEIIDGPHNEERQVVLPDGIRIKDIGWSWIFYKVKQN